APSTARERLREVFVLPLCPLRYALSADLRVLAEAVPFFGGLRATPARLAFESPIAIACLVDRAPCLPLRTCSISSRTNSPAWVLGDFPWRLAFWARSNVLCSGIIGSSIITGVVIDLAESPLGQVYRNGFDRLICASAVF